MGLRLLRQANGKLAAVSSFDDRLRFWNADPDDALGHCLLADTIHEFDQTEQWSRGNYFGNPIRDPNEDDIERLLAAYEPEDGIDVRSILTDPDYPTESQDGMHLDTFVGEMLVAVMRFRKWWRAQNAKNPNDFPMQFPQNDLGSWWEQFRIFYTDVGKSEPG